MMSNITSPMPYTMGASPMGVQPQANPNIVLVDFKRRRGMNPSKSAGRGGQILDTFKGKDKDGKPTTYRFREEGGKMFAPSLPFEVDLSTKHGLELHALFVLYKRFIDPNIQIHNPLKEAKESVEKDDLMVDAMIRLKALRQANDNETMTNLLRRIDGPIGGKTIDVIVANLNRIAKEDPARILEIDEDPDFKAKVSIDKAIEAGRIVKNDRYFYYPQGVRNGRMIADGWAAILQLISQDDDFQSYLAAASRALLDGPVMASRPSDTELSAEDKEALALLDGVGTTDEIDEEEEELDDANAMTETQIRDAVKLAIASEHLEKDERGNYRSFDGKFRTPGDLEILYIANMTQAVMLRDELKSNGYM